MIKVMMLSRANSIKGHVDLPGDKSVSHRAAMLAAISKGETRISNFSGATDCTATLDCLTSLGIAIERRGNNVNITGSGKYGLTRPSRSLNCGNSGTTMRLLAGILAGQDFSSSLVGDTSLESRPMQRIIEPLTRMGVSISSNGATAPLTITGRRPLQAIEHNLRVASAQAKSCTLLAGLYAMGETTVIESIKTRDHTERMLEYFGVPVRIDGTRITVSGDSEPVARNLAVAADISAAAFFVVAAACLNGSDVTLERVGINPTRRAFLDELIGLGAKVELSNESESSNEPIATIRVRGGLPDTQETMVIGGERIAGLIDEIPVLAVLGTQLAAGIEVRGAAELRVKESDRIAGVVRNLRQMGAKVDEFDDGFRVYRSSLNGCQIDSYGDHRIAMAFGVAALLADGETEVTDAECVAVSFPTFFETLRSVVT